MEKVRTILRDACGGEGWTIALLPEGSRKECYVAERDGERVFLAIGIGPVFLQRLSALGIAPAVLAHGTFDGDWYVVQEFIEGVHPDRGWIRTHVAEVGGVIHRYHADPILFDLLNTNRELRYVHYAEYVQQEAQVLVNRLRALPRPAASDELGAALAQFLRDASTLDPAILVPVHDEPNTSNMLIGPHGLLFVDWDGIRIGDPFRDLGPVAWWYLPEEQWFTFFALQGLDPTDEMRRKTSWFAARASLDVALWHLERGHTDDRGFLADFVAAAFRRPNPRG